MAAQSRNRPRRGLAWLIVLALILLVLVATRAAAAPKDRPDGRVVVEDDAAAAATDDEHGPAGPAAGDDGRADTGDDRRADDGADRGADRNGQPHGEHDTETRPARADCEDRERDDAGCRKHHKQHDDAGESSPDDASFDDEDASLPGLADPDVHGDWALGESVDAFQTGVTFASAAFVDAAELRDLELRHQRPSRLGRIDLSVAWTRDYWMSSNRSDALWVVATWRR